MLLKCQECGGQVSDKAAICPHCGAPVELKHCIPSVQKAKKGSCNQYHLVRASEEDERVSERIRMDLEVANKVLSQTSDASPEAVANLLADAYNGLHKDRVAFGSLTFTVGCLKEFSGHSRAVLSHILSSAQEMLTALAVNERSVGLFCEYYDVDHETALRILSAIHDYTQRRVHNKFLADNLDYMSICPGFLPTRDGQYHFGRYVAAKVTRYIAYGCLIWTCLSALGLVVCLFDPPSRKYLWGFLTSIPCAALTLWMIWWMIPAVSGTNRRKKCD